MIHYIGVGAFFVIAIILGRLVYKDNKDTREMFKQAGL